MVTPKSQLLAAIGISAIIGVLASITPFPDREELKPQPKAKSLAASAVPPKLGSALFNPKENSLVATSPSVPEPAAVEDLSPTLAGTDQDRNGVRDDVQAWLAKQPDTPELRKWSQVQAKLIQTELTTLTSPEAAQALVPDVARLSRCAFTFFKLEPDQVQQRIKELESLTANTADRVTAYLRANQQFHGMAFPESSDESSDCIY